MNKDEIDDCDKILWTWTPFPAGCKIVDIREGKNGREGILYAQLVDADGVVIISATLDYIVKRLKTAGVTSKNT